MRRTRSLVRRASGFAAEDGDRLVIVERGAVELDLDPRSDQPDPQVDFVGKFVYHCHILNHEDNGMMAIVEVEA